MKVAEVADPGAQFGNPGLIGGPFAHLALDDGVDKDARHFGLAGSQSQQVQLLWAEAARQYPIAGLVDQRPLPGGILLPLADGAVGHAKPDVGIQTRLVTAMARGKGAAAGHRQIGDIEIRHASHAGLVGQSLQIVDEVGMTVVTQPLGADHLIPGSLQWQGHAVFEATGGITADRLGLQYRGQ